MKNRKLSLDSTTKHRTQTLKVIQVKDPKKIERCVLDRLKDFQIKHRKEYFSCSYNNAIKAITECVQFHENINIDIDSDVKKLERARIIDFDPNKEVNIRVSYINKDTSIVASDVDVDTDSGSEDDNIKMIKQMGGSDIDDMKIRYLELKLEFLQLKYSQTITNT
jgi:hypothetical protein